VPPIDLRKPADGVHLLVSVRSEIEAAAAIAGGADILDVKDPARGSLGCPEPHILNAVSQHASQGNLPVTTALGEVREWTRQRSFIVPSGVAFAKLGLAGVGSHADWVEEWLTVRRLFDAQCPGIGWVAVAYVDESAAGSPLIHDVAKAAVETGCAGLLLDTCDKASGRLFDFIGEQQLDELANRMHADGKFIAAAGRLNISDIARLATCPVDIVAVRSAACEDSDRQAGITTERVATCKAALQSRSRQLSGAC
jgi:uncharacterized protein (UPF0264 family)